MVGFAAAIDRLQLSTGPHRAAAARRGTPTDQHWPPFPLARLLHRHVRSLWQRDVYDACDQERERRSSARSSSARYALVAHTGTQ